LQQVIHQHRDEIDTRFPKILRKVSGYNLAAYIESNLVNPERAKLRDFLKTKTLIPAAALRTPNSLLPILVGSEGTLATITGAELNLVPRPKH
jgi:FAD/FMN-containing dehydrogenase